MNRLLLLALALALPLALSAQSTGDVLLSVKSASGPLSPTWVTKTSSRALGWDSGGNLTTLSISGGAWGSITGTLASQTDLQAALDAKASTTSLSAYLTSATAASTYASLTGSYANPAWITSLAWSKLTGTPTTLAGYGITDALTAATAASTYAPLSHTQAISTITGLQTALDAKAPLASPTFTGSVTIPDGSITASTVQLSSAGATTTLSGTGISVLRAGFTAASHLQFPGRNTSLRTYHLPDINSTSVTLLDTTTAASTYLTTASAASSYVSLSTAYADPSWISSLAWSKISGISTSTGGNGAADNGKLLLFDAGGGLTASQLTVNGADTSVILGNAGLSLADTATSAYLDLRSTYIEIADASGSHITTLLPPLSGGVNNVRMPSVAGTLITTGGGTLTGALSFSGTTHAGLRLNNLTTTQRDAIASPAAGMLIWNTTTGRMSVHNGTSWTAGMVRLDGDTMTGVLTLPAGTVSAPSLTFTGAGTNTGIYSSGANSIDFAIGGVRRVYIDSSGQLVNSGGGIQIVNANFITNSNLFCRGGSYFLGSSDNVRISTGTGSPEGVVTANRGTLYLRQDGGASTTLYVKESGTGNTGWVAK